MIKKSFRSINVSEVFLGSYGIVDIDELICGSSHAGLYDC